MTQTPRSATTRVVGIVLAAALIAGAAFAVGRFSMFGATGHADTPTTSSAEAGFARDMQMHHAQAVDMAMTIHAKTENPNLALLSYDMATSQQSQIGMMSEWLVGWGLPARGGEMMGWAADAHDGHGSSAQDMAAAMGMASNEDLARLDAATGVEADCLFISLMTRHHQGAIDMVDAALQRVTDPRVRDVATKMSKAQLSEMDALNALATSSGCS